MTGIPNYPTVKISKFKPVSYSLLPQQEGNEKQNNFIYNTMQRGKAIPLQAWTGPEGSTSLRIRDFKTINA